jgi:hypothetical protein
MCKFFDILSNCELVPPLGGGGGIPLLHNQKTRPLGLMEGYIPAALVGYLLGNQFAIEIIQLNIHLHIKVDEHIVIAYVYIAAQYLEGAYIKNGGQLFYYYIIALGA